MLLSSWLDSEAGLLSAASLLTDAHEDAESCLVLIRWATGKMERLPVPFVCSIKLLLQCIATVDLENNFP